MGFSWRQVGHSFSVPLTAQPTHMKLPQRAQTKLALTPG
jgi:hypothetical protein